MSKRISRLVAAVMILAAMTFVLSGCSNQGGGNEKVRILTANYQERIPAQQEFLKGLFPNADIEITYMSSGNLAAKIQAEGKDTEYDIAISLSSAYANILKNNDLLKKFDNDSEYKDEYADPDGMVNPNGVWCGAILVNTVELERLGLPEPTSYEDLLDPAYKDKIVMANPNSSSTGYFFLLGILNLYGEEAGWEYFDRLGENILMYGETGTIPASKVESGEAVIGLGIDYEGMRLADEGKPVKVLFADEGAPYDFDTVLLINKKSEPSKLVLDVMKAICSPDGNAVFNDYNIGVLKGSVDKGTYPDSFKLLDMSGITDADLKSRLSAEWSERYD